MIAVKKNFNNSPAILESEQCRASLKRILDLRDKDHKENIDSKFYRHKDVVVKLKSIYSNKCAYCESYEPDPEIEHYRPKKRVGGVTGHSGYFWLCYEWSNLLPACHDCNKNGVKGNHFPVEGVRVKGPTLISGNLVVSDCKLLSDPLTKTEIPLLLNPEVPGFDPKKYFRILPDGQMHPVPVAGFLMFRQADETIRIVQLNRDKLKLNVRKKNIRYYIGRLEANILLLVKNERTVNEFERVFFDMLHEIRRNAKQHKEYSFFWSYLYENFASFVVAYIKPKYRPRLLILINQFRQNNP